MTVLIGIGNGDSQQYLVEFSDDNGVISYAIQDRTPPGSIINLTNPFALVTVLAERLAKARWQPSNKSILEEMNKGALAAMEAHNMTTEDLGYGGDDCGEEDEVIYDDDFVDPDDQRYHPTGEPPK